MDPTRAELSHAAAVDGWIAQVIDGADQADVVDLFRAALEVLWGRTVTTLGSVTLIAIGERVLSTATRRYSLVGLCLHIVPCPRYQRICFQPFFQVLYMVGRKIKIGMGFFRLGAGGKNRQQQYAKNKSPEFLYRHSIIY